MGVTIFRQPIKKENASRSSLPKIITAGDTLQSGSGMFLPCRIALSNLNYSVILWHLCSPLGDVCTFSQPLRHVHWIAENVMMICGV